MKNYESKFGYLMSHQNKMCSACGEPMSYTEKLDLAHWLSNTKNNRRSYPLFINSLLNLSLQYNKCNVARLLPIFKNKGSVGTMKCTHYLAERYNGFLERHPLYSKFVNGYFR